ncbi:uncharacterized protein CMU_001070 [Cryptosporidium muris RN66]|uniref:Serine/threonine-protein phosphatase 4 regulatory subunit 3-like central domain-containing protein n=1 Tax=Cryptosporidium muris (strain RN66) TaxID=441375 RepID=B6AG95_CRYMR|nr:uncharacterized protein CMU_001070 [Cryptosporidium muris RN66]EEA07236.1 hypothetical protein, conserved [Cryptosporidium muris RN66]|eukprot:XP_002141585.1 hypothetical protein [Cryptosporidium muris RN66]
MSLMVTQNSVDNEESTDFSSQDFNNWPLELRRVKLYEVDPDNGNWIDCGTGYLNIEKYKSQIYIIVHSDDPVNVIPCDNSLNNTSIHHSSNNTSNILSYIVDTPIMNNREYCRQKETIITWQDGNNPDLYRALSFQHSESCNTTWEFILAIAPHLCVDLTGDENTIDNNNNFLILERPRIYNLDRIIEELELEAQQHSSDNIVTDILHKGFLSQIFDLMEELEDRKDMRSLYKIFEIIRRIVVLYGHHPEIYETLLSDEYYLKFFRACEYDEALESYKARFPHKSFLQNVKFHNVVPLPDVQTIHMNYRLMYLRDVVMPRHLDEQSLQRISSLINSNFSSILNMIVTTSEIWSYLKDHIQKDFLAAKFVHAVLTVLKQHPMLSIYERHQVFMNIKLHNILREFEGYLRRDCIGAIELDNLSRARNIDEIDQLVTDKDSYTNNKNKLKRKSSLGLGISNDEDLEINDDFKIQPSIHHKNKSQILSQSSITIQSNYISPVDLAIETFSLVCDINPGLLRHAIQESTNTTQYQKPLVNKPKDEFVDDNVLHESNEININSCSGDILLRRSYSETHDVYSNIPTLWYLLCDIFVKSPNESAQVQICSIFRRILDPKNMDAPERDDSLSLFYDVGVLDRLIDNLLVNSPSEHIYNGVTEALYSARVLFCDILITCVQEHNYRIKYKVLQNQLPYRIIHLATNPFHKLFCIAAIKFLRTCLGIRDEFYYRLFAKHDILRDVMYILDNIKVSRSRGEGCVLESVILEMLDFICRNNIQVLVNYLMENYGKLIRYLDKKSSLGSGCKVYARIIESYRLSQYSSSKDNFENICNSTEIDNNINGSNTKLNPIKCRYNYNEESKNDYVSKSLQLPPSSPILSKSCTYWDDESELSSENSHNTNEDTIYNFINSRNIDSEKPDISDKLNHVGDFCNTNASREKQIVNVDNVCTNRTRFQTDIKNKHLNYNDQYQENYLSIKYLDNLSLLGYSTTDEDVSPVLHPPGEKYSIANNSSTITSNINKKVELKIKWIQDGNSNNDHQFEEKVESLNKITMNTNDKDSLSIEDNSDVHNNTIISETPVIEQKISNTSNKYHIGYSTDDSVIFNEIEHESSQMHDETTSTTDDLLGTIQSSSYKRSKHDNNN